VTAEPEVWPQLWRELKVIVQPLVEAGWAIYDDHEDEEAEYGASVAYDLRRVGEPLDLEIELTEDEVVYVWNAASSDDADDPDPPLVVLGEGTPAACRATFVERGWLP
jgi:hypothetical protein